VRSGYGRRVDEWNRLMSDLYDGLHADLVAVRSADAAALERLTTILEADVFCFRSGYFKVDAIKALTRFDLSEASSDRLERVVLAAVDGRDRREFRAAHTLRERSTAHDSEPSSRGGRRRLIRGPGAMPRGCSTRCRGMIGA
jgi:hypothetical protein